MTSLELPIAVTDEVRTFLDKFHKEHDVKIIKYDCDNAETDSHNFMSGVFRLRFEFLDKNGTMRRKSLIVKVPSAGAHYEQLVRSTVYTNEVLVLDELLPEMFKLWTEGESCENFTASCYGSTDKLTLFLEDLTDSGYLSVEKTKQLDLKHCEIALKTLARFHALSGKYSVSTSSEKSPTVKVEMTTDGWNLLYKHTNHTIDTAEQFVSSSMHKKLIEFTNGDHIRRMMLPVDGTSKNMIIHGDYWTANMLFKYDHQGRVCDSKMIDWQLCRVSSPAVDLIYFFVTSVPFEIFENDKTLLLDCYLNEFNDTLTRLRCDETDRYTRDDLENDLHLCRFFFVTNTLLMLQFVFESNAQNCTKSSKFIIVLLKWLSYIESQSIL